MNKQNSTSDLIRNFFYLYCKVKQYYIPSFIVDRKVKSGILSKTPHNMRQMLTAEDGRIHLSYMRNVYTVMREHMKNGDNDAAAAYLRMKQLQLPVRYNKG